MVQLICSPAVRERLARELAAAGVLVDDDGWTLVERGFAIPDSGTCVVFDPLDFIDVVRMLTPAAQDASSPPRLLIGQSGSSFTPLTTRTIRYFEATADGIVAHATTGAFRVRETLQHHDDALSGHGFVRINKSQLVNLLHVIEIVPWFNSRYVLRITGGIDLEVSKTYAKRLRAALRM